MNKSRYEDTDASPSITRVNVHLALSQISEKRLLASTCPSASPSAWYSPATTDRIFFVIDILSIFRKSVGEISSFIKCDKNGGHFT